MRHVQGIILLRVFNEVVEIHFWVLVGVDTQMLWQQENMQDGYKQALRTIRRRQHHFILFLHTPSNQKG
jgi:hypothetical protein